MLISAQRLPLKNDAGIVLQDWLRAPLYLGDGVRFYAVLENRGSNSQNLELVISAFDHQMWDDIWRLEIDTEDTPGNSALLFSLLEARGLQVLAVETSINTFASNHTTSVIMSAKAYSGDVGVSRRDRISQGSSNLEELWREVIVYLGDQIMFELDRKPSLKIRHVRSYKKLSDEIRSGARFIVNRNGDLLSEGMAKLTPRAQSHIEKAIGKGQTSYSAAVDTKDRLIRVLFFGNEHPRANYLQLVLDGEAGGILSSVFDLLYRAGVNIIRNQVRPCPEDRALGLYKKATGEQRFWDEIPNYVTLDLTFNFQDADDEASWQKAIDRLEAKLKALTEKHLGQIFVLRWSWGDTR